MNGQAALFLALVLNQLAAATAFLAVYLRESGWRRTAVGRHLTYWAGSAAALDLSWALLILVKWPWLIVVLFAAQAIVGAVGWQRVWLAWQARRRPPAKHR